MGAAGVGGSSRGSQHVVGQPLPHGSGSVPVDANARAAVFVDTGEVVAVSPPKLDQTRYTIKKYTADKFCPVLCKCEPQNFAKDVFGRTDPKSPLPDDILALETSDHPSILPELKDWIKNNKKRQVLFYVHNGMPDYLKATSVAIWTGVVISCGIGGIVELTRADEDYHHKVNGALLLAATGASIILPQIEKYATMGIDWTLRQGWRCTSGICGTIGNYLSSCSQTQYCQGTVFEYCCSCGKELINERVITDIKAAKTAIEADATGTGRPKPVDATAISVAFDTRGPIE